MWEFVIPLLPSLLYPDIVIESTAVETLQTQFSGYGSTSKTVSYTHLRAHEIAKQEDPKSIVLCSAISEVFLRKLTKQGYIKYIEGSEFVDTREDLIAMGDPDGGGLKEMDEKLKK